jgi:hypothetical protein
MNYPNQKDNPARQALTRAVDRAIANGSPVVVNEEPKMTKLLFGYPSTSLQSFASMNVLRHFASHTSGDFSFISYGERCTMHLNPIRDLMGTIMNCRHWHAIR